MRICAVVQVAATVACLGHVATVHGLPSASETAPRNSEPIATCHLDTLPEDCLTEICRRAGPRPTLALYLTSRSLRVALQRAAHELRQYWLDDFSIRAPFPAVPSSPCDIVDGIPPNGLVLSAFQLRAFGRPLIRFGNRYGLRNYRDQCVDSAHKLVVLDQNLNFIHCHRFGRQHCITAETSDTSPYFCIKDSDVIKFYDSGTAGEIYQFVCEDAVSHSGDRVLCHNTERNEMRLYRIDFQARDHSCLWIKFLPPVQRSTRAFIHQDAIVYDWIQNSFRHLSVFSADSGQIQWQTIYSFIDGEYDICASESLITVVCKVRNAMTAERTGRIQSILRIVHYDLRTGRPYAKDQLRAGEILGPAYCCHLVMARDEFMIWYMDDEPKSLIIIDFLLGTIAKVASRGSLGVACRASPFGPIRVQLVTEPDLE